MRDEQMPKWMILLFLIYLFFLVWIILFKMQFSFSSLPSLRSINLIPFRESVIVSGVIDFDELINNVLAFLPLGFFLEFLWAKHSKILKFLFIVFFSFSLEAMQYILGVGASDITDLLMNSLGGVLGMWFTSLLYFWFPNSDKLTKILKYFVIFCTILCFLLVGILIFAN